MVKKKLIVILAIICVVLVVDVSYLGTLLYKKEKLPPTPQTVPSASDVHEAVSLFNQYGDVKLPASAEDPSQNNAQTLRPTPVTNPDVTTMPVVDTQTPTTQMQATQPLLQTGEVTLDYTINKIEEAVAYLRNAKNYTAVKNQTGNAEILELSISWLRGPGEMIINSIIQSIKPLVYNFENGYAVDPKTKATVTPFDVLPPSGEAFRIDPAGVTKFNTVNNPDGTTTYSVWIQEETCDLNEHPKYHSTCMGYLKLEQFDLKGVKITSGTVIYHEGQFSMTVDANGVPVRLFASLPMTGSGAGELGIQATASLTGFLEDTWDFTW